MFFFLLTSQLLGCSALFAQRRELQEEEQKLERGIEVCRRLINDRERKLREQQKAAEKLWHEVNVIRLDDPASARIREKEEQSSVTLHQIRDLQLSLQWSCYQVCEMRLKQIVDTLRDIQQEIREKTINILFVKNGNDRYFNWKHEEVEAPAGYEEGQREEWRVHAWMCSEEGIQEAARELDRVWSMAM